MYMNGVEVYRFNINGNTTFNSSAGNMKSALSNPSYSLTEQIAFSLCKLLSLPKLFEVCMGLIVFLIAASDISTEQIMFAVEVHRYSYALVHLTDPTLIFDLELLATVPTSIPIFFLSFLETTLIQLSALFSARPYPLKTALVSKGAAWDYIIGGDQVFPSVILPELSRCSLVLNLLCFLSSTSTP